MNDSRARCELELQLGSTDEAHIIRTIEYWDIERKRYPQYNHCAVIVAENITSRFLNVLALFNGAIPLVAIQMQALKVGEPLSFTTVVDELTRGLVDEDEDAKAAPADRAYWESKATRDTVILADDLLALAHGSDLSLELNYTIFYIGMTRQSQPFNVLAYRPRKNHLVLSVRLPESEELTARASNQLVLRHSPMTAAMAPIGCA